MTWPEVLKLVLNSTVVSALIVGLFGVMTIKLGLGKFRSERWWEKKAASYAEVIEALHAMYDRSLFVLQQAKSEFALHGDTAAEIQKNSDQALAKVRRGAAIGSFVMTTRAVEILNDMFGELERIPAGDEANQHTTRAQSIERAIAAMTAEARKDLGT
jgi:hypothetical protein